MDGKFSPLRLLSAHSANRSAVLKHFMIEDLAGLHSCFLAEQPKQSARSLTTATAFGVGPTLDAATRFRLHALAGSMSMSPEEVERWYTEYWLVYTVMSAYVRPSHVSGSDFVEMVMKLDSLIQRARIMLPRLSVSGIECLDVTANGLVMRLREDLPRSARFVCGLLRRLAVDFGVVVKLSEPSEFGDSAVRVEVMTTLSGGLVDTVSPCRGECGTPLVAPEIIPSTPPHTAVDGV